MRCLGVWGVGVKGEYHGAPVAVKTFDQVKLDEAEEKVLRELRMEAYMMQQLSNHPNIVHFVGAVTKASKGEGLSFALVLEFCARGSLYDLLIKKKKKLPLTLLVRIAKDAATGIMHLHKVSHIHIIKRGRERERERESKEDREQQSRAEQRVSR